MLRKIHISNKHAPTAINLFDYIYVVSKKKTAFVAFVVVVVFFVNTKIGLYNYVCL